MHFKFLPRTQIVFAIRFRFRFLQETRLSLAYAESPYEGPDLPGPKVPMWRGNKYQPHLPTAGPRKKVGHFYYSYPGPKQTRAVKTVRRHGHLCSRTFVRLLTHSRVVE